MSSGRRHLLNGAIYVVDADGKLIKETSLDNSAKKPVV
jgi:hypothetical protein